MVNVVYKVLTEETKEDQVNVPLGNNVENYFVGLVNRKEVGENVKIHLADIKNLFNPYYVIDQVGKILNLENPNEKDGIEEDPIEVNISENNIADMVENHLMDKDNY